jgi:hypothetical protein
MSAALTERGVQLALAGDGAALTLKVIAQSQPDTCNESHDELVNPVSSIWLLPLQRKLEGKPSQNPTTSENLRDTITGCSIAATGLQLRGFLLQLVSSHDNGAFNSGEHWQHCC